jgi:uncharacterized protein (DUF1697 family)
MKELAASFVEAGCHDVRTYIQSGNVVFRASPARASKAVQAVSQRWGVAVLHRTAEELQQVVEGNPFAAAGRADHTLHVLFLADPPAEEITAGLDAARIAPDEIAVGTREIYLYLPNGVAQSRLLREPLDGRLKTACTMRNWRTTTKLLEIASAGR